MTVIVMGGLAYPFLNIERQATSLQNNSCRASTTAPTPRTPSGRATRSARTMSARVRALPGNDWSRTSRAIARGSIAWISDTVDPSCSGRPSAVRRVQVYAGRLSGHRDHCLRTIARPGRRSGADREASRASVSPPFRQPGGGQDGARLEQGPRGRRGPNRLHSRAGAKLELLASFVAALVLAFVCGYYLLRAITRPLERLLAVMDVMRQGDFTQRMAVERRDEFGDSGRRLQPHDRRARRRWSARCRNRASRSTPR